MNFAQRYLQYHTLDETRIDTVVEFRSGPDLRMREISFDNGLSVVLSSWKNCLPVLMYTTEGGRLLSDTVSIPEGLKYFIRGYSFSIGYMVDSLRHQEEHPQWSELLDPSAEVIRTTNTIYGPFLTTKWDQTKDIYNTCESFNYFVKKSYHICSCASVSGRKCPTGCVATAMAQIMNYWKYPIYRPNRMEPYDWCNMVDLLGLYIDSNGVLLINPNFENERNAIARLMADCGEAADMDYCIGGLSCQSFTTPIKARNALVDSFGYHPDAVRLIRSDYSTSSWKNLLKGDLIMGMPVLYAGMSYYASNYNTGAHAFVCDGYNSATDMFHFNWGHISGIDAWCTIDSIVEHNGDGNYNWNHLERAVFNIYPATTQDYCNFILPLEQYYDDYYNIQGNTSPVSYNNVPHAAAVLLSSANNSAFPSSWHIIPSGASSEYAAHKEIVLRDGFHAAQGSDFHAYITPCASCDDTPSRFNPAQIMENRSQRLTTDQNTLHKTPTVKDYVHIYPNPTQTQVTVVSEQGIVNRIRLYDVYGKLLKTVNVNANMAEVDVRELCAGVYVLRVETDSGAVVKRVVKQ